MKIYHVILCFSLAMLPLTSAIAAPNAKEARAKLREVLKAQTKFNRVYTRLSDAEKARFLTLIGNSNLADADGDGLPDTIERAESTELCDSDSDDDGKDDGSEIEDGQDPEDSDSDDDGYSDSEEYESKGKISSLNSSTEFVVGGKTWLITDTTQLKRITLAEIAVGLCVEVEGHTADGGKYNAKELKKDDDC